VPSIVIVYSGSVFRHQPLRFLLVVVPFNFLQVFNDSVYSGSV